MKYTWKDKTVARLIVIFFLLNVCLLAYLASLLLYIPKYYLIWGSVSLCILIYYLLVHKTFEILHWGMRTMSLSSRDEMQIIKTYIKYDHHILSHNIRIHIIDDDSYNAWYCATFSGWHIIFTSALIRDFHEIDIESVLAYLSEARTVSYPLSETLILLLATLFERAIITTPVSVSLVHLIRPEIYDFILDERSSCKTHYALGYLKMLEKLRLGKKCTHWMPMALAMNALQNNQQKRSILHGWYQIHEDIDARIRFMYDPKRIKDTRTSSYG